MSQAEIREGKAIFIAVLVWLALLNAGGWMLQEIPAGQKAPEMNVPYRIANWEGQDVNLKHFELAILSPAQVVSRAYLPQQPNKPLSGIEMDRQWQVIWLNVIQTASMGNLHNFYDSLVASGARPSILETRVIQTARGPLRTSLVRYYNHENRPYYLLLWYQWQGGNAQDRWHWYWEVLKLRLQHKSTPWQLVEIATPITGKGTAELQRLETFARNFYEQSFFQPVQQIQGQPNPEKLDQELPTPQTAD